MENGFAIIVIPVVLFLVSLYHIVQYVILMSTNYVVQLYPSRDVIPTPTTKSMSTVAILLSITSVRWVNLILSILVQYLYENYPPH